jgi:hypothetical protein
MKREPQSLTVHLRHAAHRLNRAAWMIDSGASALHCGRVLALTRGNTGKIRKLFFSSVQDSSRPPMKSYWRSYCLDL